MNAFDIDKNEEKIAALDTRVTELEVKHRDKEEENDSIWRAIGALETMKEMLEERITENETDIEALTTRVETNEKDIDDL